MFSSQIETEISSYQLSEFEQDVLSHYEGMVSASLMKAFRGGIMLFHNILYELWNSGARMRIVPKGTKLTDLRECRDLKRFRDADGTCRYDKVNGIYRKNEKLVVIKEEELLRSRSAERKYETLVHEFAHAIWYLILSQEERGYITHLFAKERKERNKLSEFPGEHWRVEYRRTNVKEFFAESFLYFTTPHRQGFLGEMLGVVCDVKHGERITVIELEDQAIVPDKDTLKNANLAMFHFLDRKFKNIIDPELIVSRPDGYDDVRFDYHRDKHLYYYVIYCGTINSISNI